MSWPDSVRRDAGVSLVEVLVAIGLFGLLSSLLLGFALNTGKVSNDTRQFANVNEDSRLAMERLSRELRQANEITAVQLPVASTDPTVLTFWTDFNGNGTKDLGVADPEVLTYRWIPTTKALTLTANDQNGVAVTRPLLSSIVSAFTVNLYSSLWQYDTNADGRASWSELDSYGPPVGNNNGIPDIELNSIDGLSISLTVLDGSHAQNYTTQVDLRNRNLN
jgi:type II secretory pathway pseudopilin PulG